MGRKASYLPDRVSTDVEVDRFDRVRFAVRERPDDVGVRAATAVRAHAVVRRRHAVLVAEGEEADEQGGPVADVVVARAAEGRLFSRGEAVEGGSHLDGQRAVEGELGAEALAVRGRVGQTDAGVHRGRDGHGHLKLSCQGTRDQPKVGQGGW